MGGVVSRKLFQAVCVGRQPEKKVYLTLGCLSGQAGWLAFRVRKWFPEISGWTAPDSDGSLAWMPGGGSTVER